MRPERLLSWLVVAWAASCSLNPQPDLPSEEDGGKDSPVGAGAAAGHAGTSGSGAAPGAPSGGGGRGGAPPGGAGEVPGVGGEGGARDDGGAGGEGGASEAGEGGSSPG